MEFTPSHGGFLVKKYTFPKNPSKQLLRKTVNRGICVQRKWFKNVLLFLKKWYIVDLIRQQNFSATNSG